MKKPTHVVYREHMQRMRKRERAKLKRIVLYFEPELAEWINTRCKLEKKRRGAWMKRVIIAALNAGPSNTTCTDAESVKRSET